MSTAKSATARPVDLPSRWLFVTRLADYLELTKPRITMLALTAVAVGYALGCGGDWQLPPLANVLLGTACVAASTGALNQFVERSVDAKMNRTARRPLPSGRLAPAEALWFGLAMGMFGVWYLLVWVNEMTALLAGATLLSYVAVYTPLKRVTSLSPIMGALPGAMPPVLGWTAATGRLEVGSLILFAILFLWQFPHFLAIGWLYRDDYARAGMKMLPWWHRRPRLTGGTSVVYALALVPVSLLPSRFALAGSGYFLAAVVLGAGYLACCVRFMRHESTQTARGLLWASLIYLPLLLAFLTWDHFQLLR